MTRRVRRTLALAVLLAVLALFAVPALDALLHAQQPAPRPAQAQPAAPVTDSTLLDPEALVRSVYPTVSFAPGQQTDWAAVRRLFLPEAIVVLRTSRAANTVFSVEGFINDFIRFDTIPNVARNGFRERVVKAVTTVYKDVANVQVIYEAEVLNWNRPPQRGVDIWALVRRDGRWWIASIVNEVVTPDAALPAVLQP